MRGEPERTSLVMRPDAEVARALGRRGLLEKSLFVVVCEHGDRACSSDAENYRVPLLVVGSGVTAGADTAFRSLLDLPAIVAAVMGRGALPALRPSQLLVGWSERWVYGQIWSDGSHLFVDDATGTVTARGGLRMQCRCGAPSRPCSTPSAQSSDRGPNDRGRVA